MPSWLEIGGHRIGTGHPCFVIAEVGVNHNGDMELAHQLIDAAASAGADAVKFQTFTPERLTALKAPKAEYQNAGDSATTQFEMLARLVINEDEHAELKDHADAVQILFLSSAFDEQAVSLLHRLGARAIKIPSGEITNHALLRAVAATGTPTLMSTGMCTLNEIDEAITQFGSATNRLALLHCVSAYPAIPEDCNLRAMDLMRERYDTPVGWSDHTEGFEIAVAAVALGADLIEKHVTLSRDLPGPDHRSSLEPPEVRSMITAIRRVEAAVGARVKMPSTAELAVARTTRKSLHWRRAMAPGESIGSDDLVALRPGTGLPPNRIGELVGRRVRTAKAAGEIVRPEDLDARPGADL